MAPWQTSTQNFKDRQCLKAGIALGLGHWRVYRKKVGRRFANYTPLTHNSIVIFIETPLFTKLIQNLLPDESYAELQQILLIRPETGRVIPAGCGLRKARS